MPICFLCLIQFCWHGYLLQPHVYMCIYILYCSTFNVLTSTMHHGVTTRCIGCSRLLLSAVIVIVWLKESEISPEISIDPNQIKLTMAKLIWSQSYTSIPHHSLAQQHYYIQRIKLSAALKWPCIGEKSMAWPHIRNVIRTAISNTYIFFLWHALNWSWQAITEWRKTDFPSEQTHWLISCLQIGFGIIFLFRTVSGWEWWS